MANRELRIGNLKRPDWVWSVMMWRSWAVSVGQRDGFPTKYDLRLSQIPRSAASDAALAAPFAKGGRQSEQPAGEGANWELRITNLEL